MQKKTTLINVLAITAISIIYFQIYWHYWFVKTIMTYIGDTFFFERLLKVCLLNTLFPILLILFLVMVKQTISVELYRIKVREMYKILLPILIYIIFCTISVFSNEEGRNKMSYSIYIYSPLFIFSGILWIKVYKSNENIISLFRWLFVCGVIFSIYVAITYTINPESVLDLPILETQRGEIRADTGAGYSIGDSIGEVRFTIPGISSTTYGPILVPLIFIGLFFRKHSIGRTKLLYTFSTLFLLFCVFKTISRSPLMAFIAGAIYLITRRWFSFREILFTIVLFIISGFTYAKIIFIRLLTFFATLFSINYTYSGYDMRYITVDPRSESIKETIEYIYQNPLLGMGMSNLASVQEFFHGKEHNNYLSIAASFGLPALFFYILFIISLFIMVNKRIKKVSGSKLFKDMGTILGAGLIALVVYLNAAPQEFHFIWVWFGLAAVWVRNWENDFSRDI